MRYAGKIDKWIYFMFYGTVLVIVPLIYSVPTTLEKFIMFGVMMLLAFIMIPFVKNYYLELRDDHLYIKLGLIGFRIKYEKIESIEIVDGWGFTSSMNLSREKVVIKVHNKSKYASTTSISPMDRERFVFDLKSKCVNIERKRAF